MAERTGSRQEEIANLAKESNLGMGTGGEVKELSRILREDERPERMARGFYKGGTGILVGTDRRLVFVNKGLVSLQVEDIAYDRITSVQVKTGLMFGKVDIDAMGSHSKIE